MNQPKSIIIDGTEYTPANQPAVNVVGLQYCLIRTARAGVFAGYLANTSNNKANVTLYEARRIWYWDGAATLSQLAVDGTSKPDKCKFPVPVDTIDLTEVIEIIPMTLKARDSIQSVKVWNA